MSVICQNFVQNTWRKDLCSNCFKSVTDHDSSGSPYGKDGRKSPASRSSSSSGVRYIPQATSIYQARGLMSHIPWRSLLSDRTHLHKYESPTTTPSLQDIGRKTNSRNLSFGEPVSLSKSSLPKMNGHGRVGDHHHQGILKSTQNEKIVSEPKASVGFKEEAPQIIGYGGDIYDSEEDAWELGSDHGSVCLDSFDVTEEDRAISKITKENTEFNSANLTNTSPSFNLNKDLFYGESDDVRPYHDENTRRIPLDEGRNELNHSENGYYNDNNHKNKMNGSLSRNENGYQRSAPNNSNLNQVSSSSPPCTMSTFRREKNLLQKKDDLLNGNEYEGVSNGDGHLSNGSTILHYPYRNNSQVPMVNHCLHLSNGLRNNKSPAHVREPSDPETRKDSSSVNCTEEPNSDSDSSASSRKKTTTAAPGQMMSVDSDSSPETETNSESVLSLSICEFSETVRPRSSFLHGKTDDSHHHRMATSSRQSEQENVSTSSGDQYTSDSDTQNASASSLDSSDSAPSKKKTYKVNSSKTTTSNESSPLSFSRISNDVALPSSEDQRPVGYGQLLERASNKLRNHSKTQHKKGSRLQRQDAHGSPDTEEARSVHYAVTCPIGVYGPDLNSSGKDKCLTPDGEHCKVSPYAEGSVSSQESSVTSRNGYDPASKSSRETKLAALALELEQARRYSSGESEVSKSPRTPKTPPEDLPHRQPESLPPTTSDNGHSKTHMRQLSLSVSIPTSNYATTTTTEEAGNNSVIIPPRPSSTPSSTPQISSRLSTTTTTRNDPIRQDNSKKKGGKFSLRKLLKRSKEPGRYHTIGGFSSSSMAVNPKAWKQNEYDIAKLRLEIIHPMDLVNGNSSASTHSLDNSMTEAESSLEAVCSQHTSPSVDVCSSPPDFYPLQKSLSVEEYATKEMEQSLGDDQLQRPEEDIVKQRKPPISQPSGSHMDSPHPASTIGTTTTTNGSKNSNHPARPPKPPPPPRGPRSHLPVSQNHPKPMERSGPARRPTVPARPPPPKMPDSKKHVSPTMESNNLSSNNDAQESKFIVQGIDYANLGDVRSHIAPKKPERSVTTSCNHVQKGRKSEVHPQTQGLTSEENAYEMVELAEEEDHYTYLDDAEAAQESVSTEDQNGHLQFASDELTFPDSYPQQPLISSTNDGHNGGLPPYVNATCPDNDDRKPWFNLEESYAAIASANYEALVDLVTSAVQDRDNQLVKPDGVLHWNDFDLEPEHPVKMFEDKVIYNATFKYGPKAAVTLLVTTQKVYASHNTRSTFQFPLLGLFSDYLPRHHVSPNGSQSSYCDVTKASIFVLQRSEISTVENFLHSEQQPQTHSLFLRDVCFLLLQLIHILKMFQAAGTEEIEYDLSRMLISRTNREQPPSLVLLPYDRNYLGADDMFMTNSAHKTSLCQVALQMMFYLLQVNTIENLSLDGGKELVSEAIVQMFAAVGRVLTQEKAFSLSHAKNLLEYMLWGPVDIVENANDTNTVNAIFQRWLDLQRAQNLKSLVSNLYRSTKRLAILNVYEEYQLLFLMQANVKSLKDLIAKL